MTHCLKCRFPDYTWYEVLKDNCGNGKDVKQVFDECLCSKHYDELTKQILNEVEK